ncbi:MAG: hypothetical protein RL385_2048 [Pseudomonadota bacterium]
MLGEPHSFLAQLQTFQRIHRTQARSAARRALRLGAPSMQSLAVSRVVLSPTETLPYTPPRMRSAHLMRITGGFEGEPAADVATRLIRKTWSHAATEAFTVENVTLLGKKLHAGRATFDLDRGRWPWPHEVAQFDHVVLAATYAGAHWFGHCIHDDLPLALLARELGPPVAQAREPYRDEQAYRDAFGIPHVRALPGFFARRCTFLVDYSQNASKRARYARMRKNLSVPKEPRVRVYIKRAGGGDRSLRNEPALIEALQKRGFVLLDNGSDTPARMIEVCARASQVVCVDGSHAAPAMLIAPPGSEFIDICPPQRVTETMVHIAQAAGMRSAIYVGEHGANDGSFSVALDDLLGFIDEGAALDTLASQPELRD